MENLTEAKGPVMRDAAPVSALQAMECSYSASVSAFHGSVNFPQEISTNRKRERISTSSDYITGFLAVNANAASRKRPRTTEKKSVRFMDGGAKKSVIPRSVSQEDLPSVWYSRTDYRSFREDSQSLALAFELGILDRIHPDDFCLRGLEANLSSTHLEARLASRGTMVEFVLKTQEAQKGQGIRDPEMIRGLSIVLSKDASEDALKLAAYDQEEVKADIEEDNSVT